MASLQDYLGTPGIRDPKKEALAASLAGYQRNRDVLTALGAGDTMKASAPGLGSKLMSIFGVPGNLVRAGLLEATGNAPEQLRGVSGLQELGGLLSGNLKVGFGDVAPFKVKAGDSFLTRAGKLTGALVGDIVTDPLSYLGAPGSLSRLQRATALQRTAGKLVPELTKTEAGVKGIADLVSKAPSTAVDTIRAAAGVDVPLKPEELISKLTERELGNKLSEALLTRGSAGAIKELEIISGSRKEALRLWNMFDDEIKGGLFATSLLGKPIARLTPGTGALLGKPGEIANLARFAGSAIAPGRGVSNIFGGTTGRVYGAVKQGLLQELKAGKELPFRQRFVDISTVKDLAGARRNWSLQSSARATAIATAIKHEADQLGVDTPERAIYEKYKKDAFIGRPLDPTDAAKPEAIAGAAAGKKLADDTDYMHEIAKANGIDIPTIGDPGNPLRKWSALVLTPESAAALRKLEGTRMSDADFSTQHGRKAYYNFIQDLEQGQQTGFPYNRENPYVIAADARTVNDIYKKENPDTLVQYSEDPLQVHQIYANALTTRIANKRFLDGLESSGVAFRDVPEAQLALDTQEAAFFTSATAKLVGERGTTGILGKQAAQLQKETEDALAELTSPRSKNELTDRMKLARIEATNAVQATKVNETAGIAKLDEATRRVEAARPNIPQYQADLKRFGDNYTTTTADKVAAEKVARSVRAKMARANTDLNKLNDWGLWFQEEAAKAARLGDTELERAYLAQREAFIAKGITSLDKMSLLTKPLADAENELAAARAAKANLTQETIAGQQAILADFEKALNDQQLAVIELQDLRQARREAVSRFQSTKTEYMLEGERTVKTVVRRFQKAYTAKRDFDAATRAGAEELKNRARISGLSPEQRSAALNDFYDSRAAEASRLALDEKLAAAEDAIKSLSKVVEGTRGRGKSRFTKEVKAYVDNLIHMARTLSDNEFEAAMMLDSEQKLQDYVARLSGLTLSEGRNDREVMQAFGDMYSTFKNVREKLRQGYADIYDPELPITINPFTHSLLSKEEQNFLNKQYLANFKDTMIEPSQRTSEVGKKLKEAGLDKIGINSSVNDLYGASGLKQLMEHMYQTEVDSTGWKKWINEILDPLLGVWKQTVTLGRGPGYIATNVIGGLFMNYLGNVSVADMKIAFSVVNKLESKLRSIGKSSPDMPFFQQLDQALTELGPEWRGLKIGSSNLEDLFKEFVARGAFFSTEVGFAATQIAKMGDLTPEQALRRGAGQVASFRDDANSKLEQRYRDAINWAISNRYMSSMTNMSQASEIFLRFAPFIDGYRRYDDFAAAMDKVHMLQYDYRDLSDAEQWLRRLVPFYTWTRNNVPAQLRAMVLQPGKIQRAMYANEEFQNAYGVNEDDSWLNQVLPEYLQNANGFASNWTFGDNNIGFFLKLPFEDVNNLFQVGEKGIPSIRGKALTNMLGPFIKAPIEMASGINLSTGAPALPGGEKVPGYYNLFRPLGLVSTGPEGETRANAALARGIGDLLPFLGTGERAASALAAAVPGNYVGDFGDKFLPGSQKNLLFSENQQAAGLSNFLNLTGIAPAFGLSAATLSQGAISGEVRRRTDIQNADIKTLAGRKEVDTDWLRQQLRLGYTPQQIAVMIQAGQGKVVGSESSALTPAARQKYLTTLSSLSSPPSA